MLDENRGFQWGKYWFDLNNKFLRLIEMSGSGKNVGPTECEEEQFGSCRLNKKNVFYFLDLWVRIYKLWLTEINYRSNCKYIFDMLINQFSSNSVSKYIRTRNLKNN